MADSKESSGGGGKALDNPKGSWHVFMLTIWLIILWILIVAGTAVPHIKHGCFRYGLFEIGGCGWNQEVIDWNAACGAAKSHLQAGGAFAILSIFAVTAAIVFAIVQDMLALFKVHELLTGIITAVAWFFMMITWAVVAGFRNRALCGGNSSLSNNGWKYTHGFLLFLIPWVLTTIILVVWFLKVLKVLPF